MTVVTQRLQTRRDLTTAAVRLFTERGYDETTVDQIAAAAGVARRTFFRYYQSKDDVIFPDHDDTAAQVAAVLDEAGEDEDPLQVICRGIWQVMRMYVADAELSVTRYHLLRQVPALREHEKAVVSRYERLLARYLLERAERETAQGSHTVDRPLLAEVSAAAVVAAHNHVLRQWLRSGGQSDVEAELEHALSLVRAGLANFSVDAGAQQPETLVVTVAHTGRTPSEAVAAVRAALASQK
ncbi:TetR family transcriptional regulator [Natronoglycomyces albus]|uniref:TetR family transcriptional regulator n=1 Tax=Natronoglycomyces albus TaxID=2811108 RepID=UPI001BCD9BC6|nr:TetR family transcriptional regulator [Natronoglycomyces albus]